MDIGFVLMLTGFALAAYSVVANDVIQTLGTFLSSNEERPWWMLWLYAGGILSAMLWGGWLFNDGDPAFGRLDLIPEMQNPQWWIILPPLVLLVLTRLGIPVSTTFLILSFFVTGDLISKMVLKSVVGYAVAFVAAIVLYLFISHRLEKHFISTKQEDSNVRFWSLAQWASTGFLWSQWLIQDLANIFVYLPRELAWQWMVGSWVLLVGLLALIFYFRGGNIQKVVRSKTNTGDIRSATIIDLVYALILLVFKEWNSVPMSTTWVFVGLLAGREYAIRYRLHQKVERLVHINVATDLAKVLAGLVLSIAVVEFIR